jgi:serine/threonine-protein kinase
MFVNNFFNRLRERRDVPSVMAVKPIRVKGLWGDPTSRQSIGPFQLVEELGRGATGIVFRGFDPAIGRPVAVKIIWADPFSGPEERSESKLRFAREAAAAGNLSHPNIVTVYQLAEEGGVQYLVTELVQGSSLEKTLSDGQPQDHRAAVCVLTQVADALDYAHAKGIVHRDVTPANILVRPDGVAKITDFGIARIASQRVTRTGVTFGTLKYMSPEQINTAQVSGQADQYSLGVIAYQMLSGKRPFSADRDIALMFQIMWEEPAALHTVTSEVSPRASEVVAKAMAKKPEDRFTSCLEFAERLSESLNVVMLGYHHNQ